MKRKHKKHHKQDRVDNEDEKGTRLKLVLKVGTPGGTPDPRDGAESQDEERKHRHKKKKKHKDKKYDSDAPERKRRREKYADEYSDVDDDEEIDAVPPKKCITESHTPPPPKRTIRDRIKTENSQVLNQTLDYLHKMLQRKDVNGFFAFPVTDAIAPLYSTIIQQPMDFSTIRTKVDNTKYETVCDFRDDFKMMCDNAMTYNHPDTVYYKEAKKILAFGIKQLTMERMQSLKRSLPFMEKLSDPELGALEEGTVEITTVDGEAIPVQQEPVMKKVKKPKLSKFEAIPDKMSPDAILAQARAAAKEAADQLTLRKPKSEYGFLRRRQDGSTSLTILNSDNDGKVSNKEKIVNLGGLIGKVHQGSGILTGLKEDKRNKANTVSYLSYGPFSSYAPVYDSTTANISKDESDMLLSTYGDEAGIEYCKSLRAFVETSGDYALKMVDNLLDILTQGCHSKTIAFTEEKEREREESKRVQDDEKKKQEQLKEPKNDDEPDFESLRNLSDLGIDMSFLDTFEKQYKTEKVETPTEHIQKKLDETGALIKDLQKSQIQRLSQKLPPHLALIPGPTEMEAKLAEKVTKELTELAKKAQPTNVTTVRGVRQAMGISQKPCAAMSDDSDNEGPPVHGSRLPSSAQGTNEMAASSQSEEDSQSQATTQDEEKTSGEKASSAGDKDSMDQDLDAVLDELEMEGEEEEEENSLDGSLLPQDDDDDDGSSRIALESEGDESMDA